MADLDTHKKGRTLKKRTIGQDLSESMWHRPPTYVQALLNKKPSSGELLVELDGLRGFAVLIVIASHTNLAGMRGQGAMGVWLFFVLSGFLLTKIMLAKLPQSLERKHLLKYVIRRVTRIIPLYYLCLAAVSLLEGRDGVWLFKHFTFQRANGHFWSIPQEELFYVVLPFLVGVIVMVSRPSRQALQTLGSGLLLLLAVASFPLLEIRGNGKLLPFYVNVFAHGLFIAFLWRSRLIRRVFFSRRLNCTLNLLTLPLLATLLFTSRGLSGPLQEAMGIQAYRLAWGYPSVSALLCTALLSLCLKRETWVNKCCSTWPMRVLGVLSFGLYLVHFHIIRYLRDALNLTGGMQLFLYTLILSVTLALLLERLIERPCIKWGRRVCERIGRPRPSRIGE